MDFQCGPPFTGSASAATSLGSGAGTANPGPVGTANPSILTGTSISNIPFQGLLPGSAETSGGGRFEGGLEVLSLSTVSVTLTLSETLSGPQGLSNILCGTLGCPGAEIGRVLFPPLSK
jgi:hypothetical protein